MLPQDAAKRVEETYLAQGWSHEPKLVGLRIATPAEPVSRCEEATRRLAAARLDRASAESILAALPVVDVVLASSRLRPLVDNSQMRNMLLSRRQRLWLWMGKQPLLRRFRRFVYTPPF